MIKWIGFVLLLACTLDSGAQSLEALQLNKKALPFMKEQNFTAAQSLYLQALGESPFWSLLHLNLGLSFYGQGQLEKAQASYETALKLAENDEIRFAALYNLGELFGKTKKVPEALQFYQRALEFKPDSLETKTNIELLIQDQQGGGQGKGDDQKKDQDQKKSDQKDQKDKGDSEKDKNGDKDKDKPQDGDKPKEYQKSKPQPKKFKSDDLTQGDVSKILGEIKQQEQKIQQDYNRKEVKERPRDKDW